MTIVTTPAATVTPCPVPWCPDAGHHQWTADLDRPTRDHEKATSPRLPSCRGLDIDRHWAVTCVSASEVMNADGTVTQEATVEFPDDPQLHNWQQVQQAIDGLRQAAVLAFGRSPVAEQQAEFDAAAAELINRADNPLDVNRLIAAAIRLRRAHNALCDAEASL